MTGLRCISITCVWLLWLPGATAATPLQASGQPSERSLFERQIRPLLEKCIECHGPDTQESQLRLDTAAGLRKGGQSGPVVVPGDPDGSRLVQLVRGTKTLTMPPDQRLRKSQVRALTQWVRAGAVWPPDARRIAAARDRSDHWAFQPVSRPPLPALPQPPAGRNAIDRFILHRLRAAGIEPSAEAHRSTLLRRVALDLTGLPPSREEVVAGRSDTRPDAYERSVDRLLASPHYGERWGRHWLDGARYADSGGNENDPFRSVWAYREWVIDAVNGDLPFDRFVIEQIAGDLLPAATPRQRIATAFYRQTVGPSRLDRVVERVNTTGTVFLGLTVGCAQCHSHKFDPISQREYYQLFAFFNQSDDPVLQLGGRVERHHRARFRRQVIRLEGQLADYQRHLAGTLSVWSDALTPGQREKLPAEVREVLSVNPAERSPAQRQVLLEAYGQTKPDYAILKRSIAAHQQHESALDTVLVLSERAQRRATAILLRGNAETPGPEVRAGVPRALPPLATVAPANRLDLARWLVSPRHPLTPRVAVNRVWQHFFGAGLVATENDFGAQGERPSHPPLLDWLASDFRDNGWQLKRLKRLIVTSATYRQSSDARPDLLGVDPQNRWLARQARLRLEGETIRDQALAVSGLLERQIGGPSVFPFQAGGVMQGRADKSTWIVDPGSSIYRRGLYIHFWRLTPHPYLKLFDAPDASEACTRRHRSNTPMQALALLNHPWFDEYGRALAGRVLREAAPQDRVRYAFELCLGRAPTAAERQIVYDLLTRQRGEWTQQLPLSTPLVAAAERTAWYAVARTLLNLDEFITRE